MLPPQVKQKMFVNGYFKVIFKRQHFSMKTIFCENYLQIKFLCYFCFGNRGLFFHKQKTEKEP